MFIQIEPGADLPLNLIEHGVDQIKENRLIFSFFI